MTCRCAVLVGTLLTLTASCRAAPETFGHFRLNTTAAKEDLRQQYHSWASHFQRPVSEAGFQAFTETVSDHLAADAAEALVNGHADTSLEDFRAAYLGHRPAPRNRLRDEPQLPYRYRFVTPLDSVDWRKNGVIGPIKNQHVNNSPCGCCWAFATIASVEIVNAIVTGENVALSEQQLIDCDRAQPYFDLGCQGGDFNGGFQFIIDNGIDTEEDYPYLAKDDTCQARKSLGHKAVTLDGIDVVPPKDEYAMLQGVTQHPITVALCVGDWIKQWHAYTGGILQTPGNCDDPLDHAVPIVGYSEDKEDGPYWIVKNSWGEQWGENGYLKLKRNISGTGHLGVLTQPGYPVKISPNPGQQPNSWVARIQDLGRRAGLKLPM